MRDSDAQMRRVLARGSFDSQWTCDVFYDGQRKLQDVLVEGVQHDEDGTAKVQQSGSLTLIWQGKRGESIAPRSMEDILSPFGTEIILYQMISDGPLFTQRVPMGTFVISDTPDIASVPWSMDGRALVKGDKIKITFKDPFYKVQRNRFDLPGVTPSLASVYDEIQRLTRLPVTQNPLVPDGPIPRAMVYEEDRLDAVYELAAVLDATPYMTADGTVSLRPKSWTTPVDTLSAANADDGPRVITPEGRTAWAEQRRNLVTNPRMRAAGYWGVAGGGLAPSVTWTSAGVQLDFATAMSVTFWAGASHPATPGEWWSGSTQVTVPLGRPAVTIRAWHVWYNGATQNGSTGLGDAVTIQPGETVTLGVVKQAPALTTNVRLMLSASSGVVPAGSRIIVTDGVLEQNVTSLGAPLDGDDAPGGGLIRTRWLGVADASASVLETRQIIPAVYAPRKPGHGTLVGVKRGMSAEGVYNSVVVRAQGQQAGVLGKAEITVGPLRVSNPEGADSPFGRVPYFMSSQFITTKAQGADEARKWLPRVSRPQALVLDIEEMVNPLREVGDVLNIRRKGEEFPGRVVKVKRTSAKTQTTSVMVVDSGA